MIYRTLKPFLFRLDAEHAHELVTGLLARAGRLAPARALLRALFAYEHPALAVTCAGLRLPNPLGLAAGFDKRGDLAGALGLLGFGHLEVGTVTPRPQPGNPRPRMFRLPEDHALINRLGFNSPGMRAVAPQLRRLAAAPGGPTIGINIGKNRDTPLERAAEDYLAAFVALAPLARYVTVNISSPNTPGLRQLHERAALVELLDALAAANAQLARPIFLKVSPDEPPERLDAVVEAALSARVAGLIAGNTTLDRSGLHSAQRDQAGGLSGAPLTLRARQTIAQIYRSSGGRLPIIGVGGVASAADAYQHIRAGARLIQLYTGLVYHGPGLPQAIKRGLVQLLKQDGLATIADAVGTQLA